MSTMSIMLGIDVGTTSVKVGLFDLQGNCLARSVNDYSLVTPVLDHVELDAEIYWQSICNAVRQSLQEAAIAGGEVQAIAVSSQGETIIPVGIDGKPLDPAIVWLDNRARQEAHWLKDQLGEDVYSRTGIPEVNPTWSACKIAWLREHRPQIFHATHKFLLVQDFIVHHLTNEFVTDGAVACTTLLYDILNHSWWPKALEIIHLEPDRLPEIAPPGTIAAGLTADAARTLHLKEGTPVVLGGMDQAAGAVGAGNLSPEVVSETTGGALAIQVTVTHPDVDPQGRIPVYVHSAPNRYLFVPVCDTGGMVLKWFRDNFGTPELELARTQGKDAYDLLIDQANTVSPGSDGLIMLPHLMGAFSPEYNTYARGTYFGFTLYHQRGHFIRAVLEAVAFMLRRNLELIAETGIEINELRSTGGGARSRLWRQIKADVNSLPVVSLRFDDTALLGDAMLAAVAIGSFPSLTEASKSMVSIAEKLSPIPENITTYEHAYQHYCQLYEALAPVFKAQYGEA
jgi:sugar (pentulose or hexulose) kinase